MGRTEGSKTADCKKLSIDEAAEFLKEHDDYEILSHAMPDGDTIGSSYALCAALLKAGKRAKVVCPDAVPARFSVFTDKIKFPEFAPKTVISVDVADIKLLGELADKYRGRVELAIDHHASHRVFAERLFVDSTASAVSESIYEIIKLMEIELDSVMAMALYTGIATDTGCFKFSNTTPKTHRVAAELMQYDFDFAEINRVMFDTKSRSRMELEKLALKMQEYYFDGKVAILSVTRKMMKESGCTDEDLEGITAIPRSVEGVKLGITVRQRDTRRYKISMRSYEPVDAAAICLKMQGGGHKYAAGCELCGTLSQVKAEILKNVKIALEEQGAGDNSNK